MTTQDQHYRSNGSAGLRPARWAGRMPAGQPTRRRRYKFFPGTSAGESAIIDEHRGSAPGRHLCSSTPVGRAALYVNVRASGERLRNQGVGLWQVLLVFASGFVFMRRESSSAKWRTKRRTTPLASELPLFGCRKKTQKEVRHGTSDRVLYSGAISQASEVDPAAPEGQGG
jgi:hypothetical protein